MKKIECDSCKKAAELDLSGEYREIRIFPIESGTLFTTPDKTYHLCPSCIKRIKDEIESGYVRHV